MELIKAKKYENVFMYDEIFTMVDDKGNYPLQNDKSVFWTVLTYNLSLQLFDGKPSSGKKDYSILEINDLFAVYDNDMNCITEKYETIFELLPEVEEKGIKLFNFDYGTDEKPEPFSQNSFKEGQAVDDGSYEKNPTWQR